ncbi:Protein of unknown function [Gryllus bimaculatus]|nr:Protein of unknown function [Gryllus bimaculatus]
MEGASREKEGVPEPGEGGSGGERGDFTLRVIVGNYKYVKEVLRSRQKSAVFTRGNNAFGNHLNAVRLLLFGGILCCLFLQADWLLKTGLHAPMTQLHLFSSERRTWRRRGRAAWPAGRHLQHLTACPALPLPLPLPRALSVASRAVSSRLVSVWRVRAAGGSRRPAFGRQSPPAPLPDATSSDAEAGVRYFFVLQEHGLSAAASDAAVAKKLWEKSEELVGLKEGDPRI